jgi:hypothetical protein
MAKRVFISFRFHELNLRDNLLQFFQEYGGPIQATPAYMKQDIPGEGEERIKKIKQAIRAQMDGCVGVLAVAGEDAHSSFWMNYEGGVANEFQIPKAGVHHPNHRGGFPNAHVGMKEVEWNGPKLAELVASWK